MLGALALSYTMAAFLEYSEFYAALRSSGGLSKV